MFGFAVPFHETRVVMSIPLNRRTWLWILGIGLGLLLLAGFVLPALWNVNHVTEWFFCEECGAHRMVAEVQSRSSGEVLEGQAQIVPTDLSAWYEAHYPEPCEHVWQRYHFGSVGYFVLGPFRMQTGGFSSGGRSAPRLLSLDPEQRKDLEERYAKDKTACRQYIAAQLK